MAWHHKCSLKTTVLFLISVHSKPHGNGLFDGCCRAKVIYWKVFDLGDWKVWKVYQTLQICHDQWMEVLQKQGQRILHLLLQRQVCSLIQFKVTIIDDFLNILFLVNQSLFLPKSSLWLQQPWDLWHTFLTWRGTLSRLSS